MTLSTAELQYHLLDQIKIINLRTYHHFSQKFSMLFNIM